MTLNDLKQPFLRYLTELGGIKVQECSQKNLILAIHYSLPRTCA